MAEEKKTLDEWKETIEEEVPFVDVKPYSHNIINIALMAIVKGWGKEEANNVIDDYNLEGLGWKKEI